MADDPDSGHLVVAAVPTIAPYYLPQVLSRFQEQVAWSKARYQTKLFKRFLAYCSRDAVAQLPKREDKSSEAASTG